MSPLRLLVTWMILAALMTANGALREVGLKSVMHADLADLISAVSGIALILGVTFFSFRIPKDYPLAPLAVASLVLVTLTVAFELVVGRASGRSWGELAANYRFWEGELWPLVLITLAMTPFLARGRV